MNRGVGWAASIAVVFVMGCSGIDEPQQVLDVSVSLSTEELAVGETAFITVAVTSRTARTLQLDTGPCVIYFEVRSSLGRLVAPETPSCPLAHWEGKLAPGESLAFTFEWRGERAGDDFLPPGSYRVRGVFEASAGLLFSAPVPIELVD